MPNAQIKFTQNSPGPGAGVDGQALMGVTGTVVTVASVLNTDVANAQFELLYVPPGSALTTGVKQAYSVADPPVLDSDWTFTPDVAGGFVVRLRVKNLQGNESVDDRVFGVVEESGRFIPPFGVGARALNFLGNALGWLPNLRDYLLAVDANEKRGSGREATLTTTTTGLTTIATVPLSPSGLVLVQARILAVKSNALVAKWWKIERAFHHDGTSYTAGTLKTLDSEAFGVAPSWALDIALSGANALIQVNGLTDTVKWYASHANIKRLST